MKKFSGEFKEFISRGNVIDLAVGVIIGGAFTAIVTSFVKDIVSPLIELVIQALTGSSSFSGLLLKIGNVSLTYGNFIMALVVFFLVKAINRFRRKTDAAPALTYFCPFCRMPVDAKATKCPNCTADMTPEKQ